MRQHGPSSSTQEADLEEWEIYTEGLKTIGMCSTQPKYDGFWGYVYDWQTLISGAVALLAGAVVYAQLVVQRKQLAEERRKQLELSKRQERAARIRIPHALAELMEFVENGFTAWVRGTLNSVKLPLRPVETLMSVAEAIDDTSYQTVRELVSALQVFESRHLERKRRSHFHPGQAAVDLAKLEFQIDRLFPFGRMSNEESVPFVKPVKDDIAAVFSKHEMRLSGKGKASNIKERLEQALRLVPAKKE